MDAETLESYKKAGKIAAEALAYGKSLIKPGASMVEVLDKVEAKIKELGGEIAFPAQISCDDVAAHFCPTDEDDVIFDKQVCSLDVGVQVDGFIGDTATTIDLSGEHADLVKASEDALEAAIALVKPGAKLGEIGAAIHEKITAAGFSPVKNLSGHGVDKFNIHTSPQVPNFDTKDPTELKEGTVIAIEPFATTGAGVIYESGNPTVFQLSGKKPVRNPITRNVMKYLEKLNGLPFTTRWLTREFTAARTNFALRELKVLDILREYPPLPDKAHGIVSQAEHTVVVLDEPVIITKI